MSKKNINILIVEDNPDDLFLLTEELKKVCLADIKLKTADTMKAALEIFKTKRFDCTRKYR